MTDALDITTARNLLHEVFAPWVQSLNLQLESLSAEGAVLRLPYSDALCRADKIVCGQALMTVIDTCSVFACWGHLGAPQNVTTVSQNSSFLRPAIGVDIVARGRILKAGRTLCFTDIAMTAGGDDRLVAHGTSTFAVLPGLIGETPTK